jgi:hypothetical protein
MVLSFVGRRRSVGVKRFRPLNFSFWTTRWRSSNDASRSCKELRLALALERAQHIVHRLERSLQVGIRVAAEADVPGGNDGLWLHDASIYYQSSADYCPVV